MSELLPLFPLGAVLYPGMLLPLHIFEDRYRQLIRDLLDGPEPRRFGVIAIRKGRETGIEGVQSLYEVGCTAVLRRVDQHEDGRYEIITVGTDRFRLLGLDGSLPYLQGQVELLPEETGGGRSRRPFCPGRVSRVPGRADRMGRRHRPARGTARRPGPALLRRRRRHRHRPARAAGPAGRVRRGAAAGARAGHAGPGDRHAADHDVPARAGPQEHAVQSELRSTALCRTDQAYCPGMWVTGDAG